MKLRYILPAFFLCVSCSPEGLYIEKKVLLGTIVQITVIAPDEQSAQSSMGAAFDEIKRIEDMISFYNKNSDITKINENAGRAVNVSDETFDLIKKSNMVSMHSGGAFDISFGAVGRLWKFGDTLTPPSDAQIRAALPLVNYRNIILDEKNKTVKLAKKGMVIGLGSIGKRYALGRAIAVLKKRGVASALVLTGGDLQVIGTKFGKKWNAGVKNPRGEGILYEIALNDGETVSTSGDYERMTVVKGKRFHHIFDPRTGYPTETFSSVSVITSIPENADGLSTAVFVAGPLHYKKILSHYRETSVILIDLTGKVYASKELKERLKPAVKDAPVIEWI